MKQLLVLVVFSVFIISCNSAGNTPATTAKDSVSAEAAARTAALEKNKATALASVEAFGSGKLDDAFKNVTADAVDYGDGMMAPVKGRDTIIAQIKVFLAAFPDYKGSNY